MDGAASVLSMGVTGGLIALAAVLALATVVGVALRRRAGRFRVGPARTTATEPIVLTETAPGRRDRRAGIGDQGVKVTAGRSPHSIWFVMCWTAKMLTKRRAVDFCHVATAICLGPAAPIPGLRGPFG
jgi:hypothetical protein